MDLEKLKKPALLLGTTVLLAACGNGGNDGGGNGGNGDGDSADGAEVIKLPAGAELPTMDSTLVTDTEGFNALQSVTEGLYRQSEDGAGFDEALAEGEPEVSEDGKTLTFTLKDVKWSNGDPLTANDFVYSWRRLVDPATAASYNYLAAGVIKNASEIINGEADPSELGVEAVDDHTLKVELESNVPYLNSLFAMAPFYPLNEKFVTEKGDDYATNSDNLLYIGPYTLEDWDGTGLSWKYIKNPDYWDADAVKTDEIDIQVIKETSTGLNLYETGELDRLALTGDYIAQKADDPDLVKVPTSSLFYLKYNVEKEALANVNIRKALSAAVDRQAYVDRVLQNGSQVAVGLVPAGLAANPSTKEDFRAESGELSTFDVDAAKEYWEKGLDELGVDSLTLDFLSDDSENAKTSSEFVQAQLQENLPGLTVTLTNVPFKNRLQKDDSGDYDIQLAGWGADFADPINYLELFESTNGNNSTGYSNPDYDKLIQSARAETEDLDKRWSELLEAEKLLIDDGAIGPLYQRYGAALQSPSLENFVTHTVGADFDYKWVVKNSN